MSPTVLTWALLAALAVWTLYDQFVAWPRRRRELDKLTDRLGDPRSSACRLLDKTTGAHQCDGCPCNCHLSE